jgi:hypothetical protein
VYEPTYRRRLKKNSRSIRGTPGFTTMLPTDSWFFADPSILRFLQRPILLLGGRFMINHSVNL